MIDGDIVIANVPAALRDELLRTYREIMSNYIERRWEPSELNGGKFCEAAYSIVSGAVSGTFPTSATKPPDMLKACRALEGEPALVGRAGDRSLRILIPRALPVLYEVRNNRGVGHIGGDVDPNHMDAELVQGMATWVLAELVRIFHGLGPEEAQQVVEGLVERKTPLVWNAGGLKRVLNPKMTAKDQVLLLLHHSSGAMSVDDLLRSVEYRSASDFRSKVLTPLHKARMIEYDRARNDATISPAGARYVESTILPTT
jgi:hypothetical protein